jgi:hypothetical protein
MTPESLKSLTSMLEADNALLAGEKEAIRKYWQAITFAEEAPVDDPLFNKDLMIAYCNAGLSSAYARQEMFLESLASADRSTIVLEKIFNTHSLSDAERLTMAAISKGRALINLTRIDEAKRALCEARIVLETSRAWSPEDKARFRELALELKLEGA